MVVFTRFMGRSPAAMFLTLPFSTSAVSVRLPSLPTSWWPFCLSFAPKRLWPLLWTCLCLAACCWPFSWPLSCGGPLPCGAATAAEMTKLALASRIVKSLALGMDWLLFLRAFPRPTLKPASERNCSGPSLLPRFQRSAKPWISAIVSPRISPPGGGSGGAHVSRQFVRRERYAARAGCRHRRGHGRHRERIDIGAAPADASARQGSARLARHGPAGSRRRLRSDCLRAQSAQPHRAADLERREGARGSGRADAVVLRHGRDREDRDLQDQAPECSRRDLSTRRRVARRTGIAE